jgi:hypothetical protein
MAVEPMLRGQRPESGLDAAADRADGQQRSQADQRGT